MERPLTHPVLRVLVVTGAQDEAVGVGSAVADSEASSDHKWEPSGVLERFGLAQCLVGGVWAS
jgi:hypothetical protein